MREEIYSKTYGQDSLAKNLVHMLTSRFARCDGLILYKFPVIKEMDEPLIRPDLFVVMPKTGVFQIFCREFTSQNEQSFAKLCKDADRADAFVFATLIKQKELQKNKRSLKFEVFTLKYLPMMECADEEKLIFTSAEELGDYIEDFEGQCQSFDQNIAGIVIANLEAAIATIKPKERIIAKEDAGTKAYILKYIETQIAKFDDKQRMAALTLNDGPQRIRGLAGSGKTIILCLKAAYLHLFYPEKVIVYTFYTKSLYEYIHQLITRFYLKISDGRLPDFEDGIRIMHAWGGKNVPGMYYEVCRSNDIWAKSYGELRDQRDPFDTACREFIRQTQYAPKKEYDFIIMDEAQDFPASFYQLCRSVVRDDHLIWGYDELQNILNVKIQNAKETFKNKFDSEGIDLESKSPNPYEINDIVLPKSYRNVKEILVAAIAIGFGIYNDKLVQSLENNEHWRDLGFDVLEGDCSKEEDVIIVRPDENSPLAIPDNLNQKDIIEIYSAEDYDDEIEYVCTSIVKAIKEDKLRPDDIAVISLDDRYASNYCDNIQKRLADEGIATNNLQDKNYVKGFSMENYVTLSTVYKAKGNEAAMVFVVGCDVFDSGKSSRIMRNKVFTAFTRAKVWLRISGLGLADSSLCQEIDTLEDNQYELHFHNVSSYKLDREWRKDREDMERHKRFEEGMQKLMFSMGITDAEAYHILKRMNTGQKAMMIRETGKYGKEEDE